METSDLVTKIELVEEKSKSSPLSSYMGTSFSRDTPQPQTTIGRDYNLSAPLITTIDDCGDNVIRN